jgi:elongation factor P
VDDRGLSARQAGKGAAFVRTKIKNIMTGAVLERTFNPTDKMPRAIIETKEMQYLYSDGDLYHFMDTETFEQIGLTHDQVEDAIPFVKEETNVTVRFFKGAPFSVAAPNFVELKVIETEPGFRGDTATGTTKPATVETGYTVQVPLFVEVGDTLRIDTRNGEYMERA